MNRLAALSIAAVLVAFLGFIGNSPPPAPSPQNTRHRPSDATANTHAAARRPLSAVEPYTDYHHGLLPPAEECSFLHGTHSSLAKFSDPPSAKAVLSSKSDYNQQVYLSSDGWRVSPGGVINVRNIADAMTSVTIGIHLRVSLSTSSTGNPTIASLDFGSCTIVIGTRSVTWNNGQFVAATSDVLGPPGFWVAAHLRHGSATVFIVRPSHDNVVSNTVGINRIHPHEGAVSVSRPADSIGEVTVKKIVVFERETADRSDIAAALRRS